MSAPTPLPRPGPLQLCRVCAWTVWWSDFLGRWVHNVNGSHDQFTHWPTV